MYIYIYYVAIQQTLQIDVDYKSFKIITIEKKT